MDSSFIPKSGKKTDGLEKFYNGSAQTAEKGLEISLLSLVDVKTKTVYALDAVQKTLQTHFDKYNRVLPVMRKTITFGLFDDTETKTEQNWQVNTY